MDVKWSIENDLYGIVESTADVWESLRHASFFITGGTGFIGTWLLETLKLANEHLNLALTATILTRDRNRFSNRAPHLVTYPAFTFINGDVQTFVSPKGHFTHVIHAATDTRYTLCESDPKQIFDTIVNGTHRVLDFVVEKRCEKVLYLSSGAVYGPQPDGLDKISENYIGSLDFSNPRYCYSEGKRAAEMLCGIYEKQFSVEFVVARIFALVGPHLPLDEHYAIGNFIRNAIDHHAIVVNGNGSPVRSYLYIADLIEWLCKLLTAGKPGVKYNVGSEEAISIRSLAEIVARTLGNGGFETRGETEMGINPGRYIPDTTLIRSELGVHEKVTLQQSILRTALWNGWYGSTGDLLQKN